MRYKIGNREIRTENAAKPISQASWALLEWIAAQDVVESALDYGCGKLRYAGALARRCRKLTLVDSQIQLDRMQLIGSERTTVREYAKQHWPHARVLTIDQFEASRQRYDLILCANVLSAIPDKEARSKALACIAVSLRKRGIGLFVAQYRNSYFSKLLASKRAVPHLDGWILKSARGYSYCGLLPEEKLRSLIQQHGLSVEGTWIEGQSVYLLARRCNRN